MEDVNDVVQISQIAAVIILGLIACGLLYWFMGI